MIMNMNDDILSNGNDEICFLVISQQNLSETSLMPIIWLNFRKNNYEKYFHLCEPLRRLRHSERLGNELPIEATKLV